LFLAVVYLAALLIVGILTGRKKRDSNQFLNATGSLPLWVCIIACIAANCGSLDVMGMMALGAQYGTLAFHFYWIGAIPALVVVAFWLLPAYARGRYPTVLDYISHHYGSATRSLVSLCMSLTMLLLAGVCLCAVAQVIVTFLGLTFLQGVLITAPVVLFYTWAGGFRATVYTELLHFVVVLAALVPLLFLTVNEFGGFDKLLRSIPPARFHAWHNLPLIAPGATMDRFGLIVGLGLVLSFSYWSTDFVQMQRALAVRMPRDVPYIPLSMAASKLIFALLVVLPGVAAPLILGRRLATNWNATLPEMMIHFYGPAWVAIGVMGLVASLVSTFANNVAGFTSAWVQGIYQPRIRPQATDSHYLWVGRTSNAAAVIISIGSAYVALRYQSLMEYIQLILSTFNAPLFALVALAALAPRRTARGGVGGFAMGVASAMLQQSLVIAGVLHFGSQMSANFYTAILSFAVTIAGTVTIGVIRGRAVPADQRINKLEPAAVRFSTLTVMWAIVVAGVCVLFNVLFW